MKPTFPTIKEIYFKELVSDRLDKSSENSILKFLEAGYWLNIRKFQDFDGNIDDSIVEKHMKLLNVIQEKINEISKTNPSEVYTYTVNLLDGEMSCFKIDIVFDKYILGSFYGRLYLIPCESNSNTGDHEYNAFFVMTEGYHERNPIVYFLNDNNLNYITSLMFFYKLTESISIFENATTQFTKLIKTKE